MTRICELCGRTGDFHEIKKVDLPVSGEKKLCNACYTSLYTAEKHEFDQIQRWMEDILRRFPEGTLKQFCREHDIPTSEQRSTIAASRRGTRYKKFYTYHYNFEELLNGEHRLFCFVTVDLCFDVPPPH